MGRRLRADPRGTRLPGAGDDERGLYEKGLAVDRVRAVIETSRKDASPLVVTARCKNFLRGNPDLADTLERLQAYQEAGADALYAPALSSAEQVRSVVAAIDRPLNVLLLPGGPTVPALFAAGASRVSTGSALATAAQDALVQAARELLDAGTTESGGRGRCARWGSSRRRCAGAKAGSRRGRRAPPRVAPIAA